MRAFCQQQTLTLFNIFNKCGNGIDIYRVRRFASQTHNNGDIRVMPFAGQRQRTVNIHGDPGDLLQLSLFAQQIHKLFTRFHRADSVRTRGANAHFEHVENTNHR